MTVQPFADTPYPDYDVRKIVDTLKYPSDDLVHVFPHRALCLMNGSTENSYSAVAAAARAGYEGIEIDVRLTKDQQVVVFHDNGLGRLTNVEVPEGEEQYNPFTGKGYSPLVEHTNWFGEMENLCLRDDNGYPTKERPILLVDLLNFIREQGINMLVQLDIKHIEVIAPTYNVVSQACNQKGVPGIEWCIWKCQAAWFPFPSDWEQQDWVKKALAKAERPLFTPLYEIKDDDTIPSIKQWAQVEYMLTFEIHVPYPNHPLQPALDLILASGKGVGSWYMSGDLPREYYDADHKLFWDDSAHRADILAFGRDIPCQLHEGRGVKAVGGVLGGSEAERYFDGRTHLKHLLGQGFSYLVADPFDELSGKLGKLGKRNVSRMLAD